MARPYQSRKKVEAAVVHQYLRYCHSGEQEQHHLGGFAYVSEKMFCAMKFFTSTEEEGRKAKKLVYSEE